MPRKIRTSHYAEFVAIWQETGPELTRLKAAELLRISLDTFDKWKKPSYGPGAPHWAVEQFPTLIVTYYTNVLKMKAPPGILARLPKKR